MPSLMGWAAFAALSLYLVLFFTGTLRLSQAGQRIWLFGAAQGMDRLAAIGFRGAFVLAFLGPLLWQSFPWLHKNDPLWNEFGNLPTGVTGAIMAWLGTSLALAAQSGMGRSWRVGVVSGQSGDLVTGGLFAISRNPVFLGQALLLTGIAFALPALATAAAPMLFLWSARSQIRSEEAVLLAAHGESYARYMREVPRWIGPRRATA